MLAERSSHMSVIREHERLTKELKKATRRERRKRVWEEDGKVLADPIGTKAQAIKTEKRGRKRAMEMGRPKGKQVTSSQLTSHVEQAHDQQEYEAIGPIQFTVTEDMRGRLEKAIRRGKPNKAVDRDRVHVEMLIADPDTCAKLFLE